jgi:hypothetical protein
VQAEAQEEALAEVQVEAHVQMPTSAAAGAETLLRMILTLQLALGISKRGT